LANQPAAPAKQGDDAYDAATHLFKSEQKLQIIELSKPFEGEVLEFGAGAEVREEDKQGTNEIDRTNEPGVLFDDGERVSTSEKMDEFGRGTDEGQELER